MDFRVRVYGSGVGIDDALDFADANDGYNSTSYLQSAYFQWWDNDSAARENLRLRSIYGIRDAVYAGQPTSFDQAFVPKNYKNKTSLLGRPELKALVADGFRYWRGDAGPDVDITFEAGIYGCFGTSTPIYARSTAYDVEGNAFPVSYRHNERINAGFADGHVDSMNVRESHNPTYWYPSRSTFVGAVIPSRRLETSTGRATRSTDRDRQPAQEQRRTVHGHAAFRCAMCSKAISLRTGPIARAQADRTGPYRDARHGVRR
jgi:prepilin-type processing-associated H-X9-DG protein